MRQLILCVTLCAAGLSPAAASDRVGLRWSFEGDGSASYVGTPIGSAPPLAGVAEGTVDVRSGRTGSGHAIEIERGVAFLRVTDPGEGSPLDFTAGDVLTLEAWVRPLPIGDGQHFHIVGKGRTGNPGVAADNLNYALRLTGKSGQAALSFLFRSAPDGDPAKGEYHRWTSRETFACDDAWHHVAVTYRFGDPASLHGYLDGVAVEGAWDMGGATDLPPAVDNDELWIGSGVGGAESSTFHGGIDDVVVWRGEIPAEELRGRAPVAAVKPSAPLTRAPADQVLVEIFEGFPTNKIWPSRWKAADESYAQASFGFSALRRKYNARAVQVDRTPAFGVRASSIISLPAGDYELLLRARSAATLRIDGQVVAETPFFNISSSGHGHVRDWRVVKEEPNVRRLQIGDHETLVDFTTDGSPLEVRLELYIGGGDKLRPELGETGVFVRRKGEPHFRLLGHGIEVPLTDAGWLDFARRQREDLLALNAARRREVGAWEDAYWQRRHDAARAILQQKPSITVPERTTTDASDHPIDRFIDTKLTTLGVEPTDVIDDFAFLRRVTLDLIGTIPTPEQIQSFLADSDPGRRERYIDRLLDQPGWADHWVGYWQDALAENPNLINPTLNNTGPFRWWLHESFAENKPFDRFAAELIRMEGSSHYGGPGGFEMATQNDVPMAAKAHVIGQALLAVDFSCARCHDSPTSDLKQADLFGLAALLRGEPQEVPKTSSVPPNPDPNHVSLVEVTLKPGTKVPPSWTLPALSPADDLPSLRDPADDRERFAAFVTSPHNERFAKVIVNRLWKRYLGRGLVEPVHNWAAAEPPDPDLLAWLSREFVESGYDLKALARLILTSRTYQREPLADPSSEAAGLLPVRRRMTAEQLVDSLFVACGKRLNTGELAIDADGAREYTISLNLGRPLRAWEFTSLSNERDRPSLSLPRAQPFVTFLEAFGWQGARQGSIVARDEEPNVLQPGEVANGVVARRFTRLSDDSAFTDLALKADSPDAIVEATVLRVLARPATPAERILLTDLLREGFDARVLPGEPAPFREYTQTGVSWSNQHDPRSTQLQEALAAEVTAGDPPTARLQPDWRQRYEDLLWSLINAPEFVFVP